MFSQTRNLLLLAFVSVLLTTAIWACSTESGEANHLAMTLLNQMPMEVQSAPLTVQTVYQFNTANPDSMEDIPCYCGCGNIGHMSNYDYYIFSVDDKGSRVFNNHALSCPICMDITQDVMRMLQDGKSPQEARAAIDATYSKYGPSNIP